jgi:hypothetical protein
MVVGQTQAELPVDLSLVGGVGGVGLAEHGQQAAEGVDKAAHLVPAHPPVASNPVFERLRPVTYTSGHGVTRPGGRASP